MAAGIPRWLRVPLGTPPQIEHLARGEHGHSSVEVYELGDVWSLHLYQYAAELWVNGTGYEVAPRWASLCPPRSRLEYHMQGPGRHRHVLFALAEGAQPEITMPLVRDVGDHAGEVGERLDHIIAVFAHQPRQAEAALWDLLWYLTELPPAPGPPDDLHPALRMALRLIELNLADIAPIPAIARSVGLSPTHLTRLFRGSIGTTVVGYIRSRRLDRAEYLLAHSTQSIKSIAAEVGIPDLHAFNKAVRDTLGMSPRDYRRSHGGAPSAPQDSLPRLHR